MIRTATTTRARTRPAKVTDLRKYRKTKFKVCMKEAQEQMTRGHEDEALEAVFGALALMPRSYDALSLAGTLLAMLGDPRASAVYTREAIRVRPDRADAYYDLGATLMEIDEADEALRWIEEGVTRIEGRDDDLCEFLQSARIEALVQLGRIEEAENVLAHVRSRSDNVLGLLDGCAEAIERGRKQPRLRVV